MKPLVKPSNPIQTSTRVKSAISSMKTTSTASQASKCFLPSVRRAKKWLLLLRQFPNKYPLLGSFRFWIQPPTRALRSSIATMILHLTTSFHLEGLITGICRELMRSKMRRWRTQTRW